MDRFFRYIIEEEQSNQRISSFLMERGFSAKNLKDLKKQERSILRNGVWAYVNEVLNAGDVLEVMVKEPESSGNIVPVLLPLDIVYEDEDILIVNKPGNMPTHPSQNHYEDTLANAVMYYYAGKDEDFVFRCLNRLDRETSGLTLIAKNMISGAMLSRMIREREIEKEYIALVEGMIPERGTVDKPIGRVEGSTIERRVDERNGESAVTHYTRMNYDEERNVSTVRLWLESGRTHQIRVHMAFIGHPLLGDGIYNPSNHQTKRQALHCARLAFLHPVTKKQMVFEQIPPEDMSLFI